ncbi:transcription antitermination factor NusB [Halocola ammonii]
MLNRRHLRIKVLQSLYAYYQSVDKDMKKTENEMFHGIEKMYHMYLYLLLLIVEMQGAAIEKIEAGKNKRLPSEEDLHPNTRFVTNAPLRVLANSKTLKKAAESEKINWSENPDLIKKEFRTLIETDEYKEYMESSERGFHHDRIYLIRFFKKHLVNFEMLQDWFEEKSIFWNDDLDLVASMVIKTIKSIDEKSDDLELLPLWKEDEKEFVTKLFRNSIVHGEEYSKMIDEFTKNWELDRIAIMDIILMKMAIAEAITFKNIPLKVTLNEYIELSKYYSTPKSHGFLNGVLDKLFAKLKDEGAIKKTGRGLVE